MRSFELAVWREVGSEGEQHLSVCAFVGALGEDHRVAREQCFGEEESCEE